MLDNLLGSLSAVCVCMHLYRFLFSLFLYKKDALLTIVHALFLWRIYLALLLPPQVNQELTGIIAASAGNHAQGVALVARKTGLPCIIVCPTYAPETKLSAVRQYGAEVIKCGGSFEEAVREVRSCVCDVFMCLCVV